MTAVARVMVDTGLQHLDRLFDYAIPEKLDAIAQPGVRVKVRFAGAMREGWLVERADSSEHRLSPLASVVSAEPVLAPEILTLAVGVAERFGGLTTDVLRSAVPPRQAKVEKEEFGPHEPCHPRSLAASVHAYPGLPEFVEQVGEGPRASWLLLPSRPPLSDVVDVIAAVDGGALVVLPDHRDISRLERSLRPWCGENLAILSADLPPAQRYRNFLRTRRGVTRIVVGTRSAIFAPVQGLKLIIVVDDGDESHVEPHAPGWNVRAVAALRAHQQRCALLFVGNSVSVETQALVDQGWLGQVNPEPAELKRMQPRAAAHSDPQGARVPTSAWKVIKTGLTHGPVLVCVAFTGYQPTLQCAQCRSPAECRCGGRIAAAADGRHSCRLCGATTIDWRCPHCAHQRLRATSVGAQRVTEELGKAFPGIRVVTATGNGAEDALPNVPAIVVSTTGVEPEIPGGYAAAVILDTEAQLARADLRVEEEARRRWFNALALCAPGAPVALVGDPAHPVLQAIIAWSPRRAATREAEERERSHLPPAWQLATIDGQELGSWSRDLEAAGVEVLGPLTSSHGERLVARHARDGRVHLAEVMRTLMAARTSRKEPTARIRIDPFSLD
jgi:primosomal protein N' (replication factor Y)